MPPQMLQQPRQLHHQPRQRRALAGAAGRGAGRGDLPGLRRGRGAVRRGRLGARASPPATWASARTASRPTASSSAWSCTRKYTVFAEGCARPPGQAADRALRARRRQATRRATASASRSCGRSIPTRHTPGLVVHTAGWPLDSDTYGGSFLYHLDEQPGRDRLRRRPRLPEPVPVTRSRSSSASRPTRRSASTSRGRQAHLATARARSPRAGCSRCPSRVPGRRAGRLRCRLPQRAAIKGSHAAIKTGMLAAEAAFDALAAGASATSWRPIPSAFEASWLHAELNGRATSSSGSRRACDRGADDRHRAVPARAARRRGRCTTSRPTTRTCKPASRVQADRLPQARRQAHLRPAVARCSSPTPTTTRTSRRT